MTDVKVAELAAVDEREREQELVSTVVLDEEFTGLRAFSMPHQVEVATLDRAVQVQRGRLEALDVQGGCD